VTVDPHALDPIFYPRSIAVVGASREESKRGFRTIQKLLEGGFPGAIYPINPKEQTILGLPCFASLRAVPGSIDLAVVCTPASTLPDLIPQCGEKGVKGAVVLAGGFAEAGDAGRALQERMVALAKMHRVRIVGPNTSGLFNTHHGCNIVGFSHLQGGPVGLLSQSGNLALALATEAEANGHLGLSTYVGVGNESDIQLHEYLDFFAGDRNTGAVVAYLEGLKDGRAFLSALRRITRHKPVVIYKSGRTQAGQGAAKSHTGALAGEFAVSAGVLRQAGAVLARRSDELLPMAEALSLLPPLASRRIAVLADGGGHGTIAADALTEQGLALAGLADSTKRRLQALLPAAASVANPVDVAGGTDTNPALFFDCAQALLEDPAVAGLLITGLYGGYGERFTETLTGVELETSRRLAALSRQIGKPLIVHSLYGVLPAAQQPEPLRALREAGIPIHGVLERAVACLEALAEYGEVRKAPEPVDVRRVSRSPGFEGVLSRCRAEGRTVVLEPEARAALAEVGVAMPAHRLATHPDEAVRAFHELGDVPVALKIVSRNIVHKSEAHGVRLGISSEPEVRAAFAEIVANAKAYAGDPNISGVLVTPMAPSGGVELILGVVRDPTFGPVLMAGLGGVFVDVLKDVAFRALPLTADDALALLGELRASAVLNGVRGAAPVDKNALVRLMLALSDLCTAFPEIVELDLNPVRAYPQGTVVLDARILV
jgi:acetate---CoA ligase (ADP-forming)